VKENTKEDRFYYVSENEDFTIKYDFVGEESMGLDWIYNKTNKYNGTDLFKCLVQIALENNLHMIKSYAIKGGDMIRVNGIPQIIQTNGYYTILRGGFIPDGGVDFLNGVIGTDYVDLESAYNDPSFWSNWRENGIEFVGFFYLAKNSLSFDILDKKTL
jgi:hypothetical protein